jgi:hypothetical protein
MKNIPRDPKSGKFLMAARGYSAADEGRKIPPKGGSAAPRAPSASVLAQAARPKG